MYFDDFSSYKEAIEGGVPVYVSVHLKNGTIVRSSAIPPAALGALFADLDDYGEAKSNFAVWVSTPPALHYISYDSIERIEVTWQK